MNRDERGFLAIADETLAKVRRLETDDLRVFLTQVHDLEWEEAEDCLRDFIAYYEQRDFENPN